jgi:hypothetical protein
MTLSMAAQRSNREVPTSFSVESNFFRELAFASHHAIHHIATIKLICENNGSELPADFGVAPST